MNKIKLIGINKNPTSPSDHIIHRRHFLSVSGAAAIGYWMGSGRFFKMPGERSLVSIGQATGYDPSLIRRKIEEMFNQLGGISDVVKPGDKVAIKVNLTGGIIRQGELPYSPVESFQTHPEVVRAVAELAIDSGAKKLYIVDGVFDDISYGKTGYAEMVKPLNAELIDLNNPHPYKEFMHKPVGDHFQIYENFILNRLLDEIDAFISIPKLKCHQCCGVTLSLKNNFGLPPVQFYDRPGKPQGYRAAMHGGLKESRSRLAKVITDINIARPAHLTIVDGIMTSEGGEGPWYRTFHLKKANVLIAGKDPVATDAVATAAMGFDPDAKDFQSPFVNCQNHLAMANAFRLGTNKLNEIKIVGAILEEVVQPFKPCKSYDDTDADAF